MAQDQFQENDPRHHTSKIKKMLDDTVASCARRLQEGR
jgi:hypothetical protein